MAEMDTAELIEGLVNDAIHWQQVVNPAPDRTEYEARASEVFARIRSELPYLDRNFIDTLVRHLNKQAEALRELGNRLDGGDQALVDLVESPELREVFEGTVVSSVLMQNATYGTVSIETAPSKPSHHRARLHMQLPPVDLQDWSPGQRYQIAVVER
jgi:hypothetical protein